MYRKKLRLLVELVLALCLAVLVGCKDEELVRNATKPNIVFILADDLGANDLSYTGSKYYETPNIDAIANSGVVFTNGYASAQVCSPSRASILLGQSPARHGITDWIGAASGTDWRKLKRNNKLLPPDYLHDLPKEDVTLAEALGQNGYKTFFAGKWHLGSEDSWPTDHGFDINVGGWDSGGPRGGYFSPWENPNLENREKGENLSMRLANETARFLERNKDSTFFAYLSFYAVHGPIQTTQKKWKRYRDKAENIGIQESSFEMERVLPIRTVQDNPVYAGLVEQMDDAVGVVLDRLKELGLEDNTIIVFTSDNGGVASGDAFSTTNYPLRGGKGYQWEGGIREPYFIKVPWVKDVKKADYPAIGSDFYPTLLDLAGIPLKPNQHKDGVSLKPLLEGGKLDERPLFWHYPHYGNQGGEPSSIIREGDWKLIHYWEDDRNELYNLISDPMEQHDVLAKNPELGEMMENKLNDFLKNVNANIPEKDVAFDPELAKQMHQEKIDVMLPRLEAERMEFLSKDFQPNDDWWGSQITKD